MNRIILTKNSIIIFAIILSLLAFINKAAYQIYTDYAIVFSYLLFFIYFLCSKFRWNEFIKFFTYIGIAFIYSISTLVFTHGGVGSVFTYLFPIIYLFVMDDASIEDESFYKLTLVFIAFVVIWGLFSNGYVERFVNNRSRYINSNSVASAVEGCAIYVDLLIMKLNRKKIYSVIVYIFAFICVLNCQDRTAAICMALFIILAHLIPKKIFTYRMVMIICIALMIMGFLFPMFYVWLYKGGAIVNTNFLSFSDKSFFSGRELIWVRFFDVMGKSFKNWMIGVGSNAPIYLYYGEQQHLHNNSLAIITCFGIVGYVIFFGYILAKIRKILKNKEPDKFIVTCIISFFVYLIAGFTENSMVGFNLFPLFGIGIALIENNKKCSKETAEIIDSKLNY